MSNSLEPEVLAEESSYVRMLTLNRPKQLNALSFQMISELLECFQSYEEDSNVKLIILKGKGRAFCAGGDVAAVVRDIRQGNWRLGARFFAKEFTLNYIMATYRKPQVSILKGIVMGGGAGVSVHGRFRVATENTVFAMPETALWSWSCALAGAASAAAVVSLISAKPKDPTFHLISISLTSLKLNLPVLDIGLVLTVHVTNPNITAVNYSSTTMSIFYDGSLLGSADVKAGSQPPRSCEVLRLPARLDSLELAQHAGRFLADVGKREMVLDAKVDIEGAAKVMWWDHKFRVHVDSHVTVDPVFLDVIDQENKSRMNLVVA